MDNQYIAGEKVDLVILRRTDLGFIARINDCDQGLLYHNEIFQPLEPGQSIIGYIKTVREDGNIDLLLQPFGNQGADDLGQQILEKLKNNKGFLAINDKSPAEEIYEIFGVSKKKYKIALGGLYKRRLIKVLDRGIELVPI